MSFLGDVRHATIALHVGALLALVLVVTPGVVLAESALDEGQRLYEEAELEQALGSLERAEASNDLTDEDVGRLFQLRFLVHRANGNDDAASEVLQRLAVLRPDHTFDQSVPPEVSDEFAEICAATTNGITVTANVESSPTGAVVRATAEGDSLLLVREVRISGRVDDGPWQRIAGGPLEVTETSGQLEFFAEAIGPGGVVIRRSETMTQALGAGERNPEGQARRRRNLWIGLGAGGAAVVTVVAIVLGVTLGGGERVLQPTFPAMVEE